MGAAGTVVYGDPLVVIEVGLVVGVGSLDRVRPGRAIIVRARDGDLLATLLWKRIRQAGVIDHDATAETEAAVRAASWAVIQARIASRNPADRIKARQVATRPGLAIIGRAIISRGWHAWCKGARAAQGCRRAPTERLPDSIIGAGDEDASKRITGNCWLILFVLREGEIMILIHQGVAYYMWGLRRGKHASSDPRTSHDRQRND